MILSLLFMLMISTGPHPVSEICGVTEIISLKKDVKPSPIHKIVQRIAMANIFILQARNKENKEEQTQIQNDTHLTALATSSELEELIRTHKNAVVRAYAFKALAKQMHHIPEPIMQIVSKDKATLRVITERGEKEMTVNQVITNFLF